MLREERITGRIGAALTDVDLTAPIGEDLAEALRDALARHQVIVLPEQHLDLAAQKRLTQVFGPLFRSDHVAAMEGEPYVIRVLKEAEEGGGVFGGDWHADFSFLPQPPAGSVLNGIEIPPQGGGLGQPSRSLGDAARAAEAAAGRARRDPCRQALWRALGAAGRGAVGRLDPDGPGRPEGGRGAAASGGVHQSSDGQAGAVSQPALRHPARRPERGGEPADPGANPECHTLRPEFQCRLRWRAGTVAVRDNFATQHYAVNDYQGHRRLIYRTSFCGPSPAA